MAHESVVEWLLQGDPAIRWQVRRDLLRQSEDEVRRERERVTAEGWGARLLSCQDPDGNWSGRIYNGKWVSTTYSLWLLSRLGALPDERIRRGCRQLLDKGLYQDEEIRFSAGQRLRDNGVTAMVLDILCGLGVDDGRLGPLAEFLVRSQNRDGSWYYDDRPGAEQYAFDNTLAALRGLRAYTARNPAQAGGLETALHSAEDFLLERYLYREPGGGRPIRSRWLLFSFPDYWFYDVLAALDYFRDADRADPRLSEAVEIMTRKRNPGGTWNLQNRHAGKTFFDMEAVGQPSRWNTLRCLRVLIWWEAAPPA